jgi:uncharacterized protein (DUF488 family)
MDKIRMIAASPQQIWTVGHSTRGSDSFIELLNRHGIQAIADIRRFPGSRRLPQFMSEALQASLAEHDISYKWIEALGGRRKARLGPSASAWRNASFRGYAEHLRSEEFANGLQQLLSLAAQRRTAMMCAEVLWWRCHRSMVADVLKLKGIEVMHIQDEQRLTRHPFTSPARQVKGLLSYDEDVGEPLKTAE